MSGEKKEETLGVKCSFSSTFSLSLPSFAVSTGGSVDESNVIVGKKDLRFVGVSMDTPTLAREPKKEDFGVSSAVSTRPV